MVLKLPNKEGELDGLRIILGLLSGISFIRGESRTIEFPGRCGLCDETVATDSVCRLGATCETGRGGFS